MSIEPARFENVPAFPEGEAGQRDRTVHAIVETPARRRHKYAFEPKYGAFTLRATLAEGLQWPYDYGFIPQTRAEDGDALDVLLLIDEPTFPGCLVKARVVGIIRLKKNGKQNDRILACAPPVPGVAQSTDPYHDIADIPKETVDGIARFLVEYSEEQGHRIEFGGTSGRKEAFEAIDRAVEQFRSSG